MALLYNQEQSKQAVWPVYSILLTQKRQKSLIKSFTGPISLGPVRCDLDFGAPVKAAQLCHQEDSKAAPWLDKIHSGQPQCWMK